MGSLKALTNRYNDLRSQLIHRQRMMQGLEKDVQEAANALAVEEAKREGVVVGGKVSVYFFGKLTEVFVVQVTGAGPGNYKARVALPRLSDGQPSKKTYVYRRDELHIKEGTN